MKLGTFIKKVTAAKNNGDLIDLFDQVELDTKLAERKKLIEQFQYMLSCHSGQNWGHYDASTAVTEYRAILKKKLDEEYEWIDSQVQT